ncbi:hypothetical protein DFP72DRAFT_763733, partial [Ephemerocybe angulata]
FRRGFVWSSSSKNISSPSALYTETAPPLPSPPSSLLDNPAYAATIAQLGDAIKVDTPFNVDALESLLTDHPNQPFVKSVMRGLREGFWPFDEGEWEALEKDFEGNHAKEEEDLDAIRAFRDKELAARPLVTTYALPPGMKLSPLFVVWQKEKARVITDHTASGLNDGIPREEAKVRYDDMRPFGGAMRAKKEKHQELSDLITFKSDVQSAFLNLAAHPLWQIRQAVEIDRVIHIVRRLVFGNRASPRIWCAVSALLCWIGIFVYGIDSLHVYMDDFFGIDVDSNLVFYQGRYRPASQAALLRFWDFIGCPWEEKKQEHGACLKIIGFYVDINRGSISLAPEAISTLLKFISDFLASPDRKAPLQTWQRLAGYINWALNVLLWGRPGLCEVYRKMAGKSNARASLYLNRETTEELTWLHEAISSSLGVSFITEGCWKDEEADLVVWTDASLRLGMAFVFGNSGYVYPIRPCPPGASIDIFFLELVA